MSDRGQAGSGRRKTKKSGEIGGSPHWMTTYSDMVTLLLTFFILLYSISVIDIERFQTVIISIQTSFLGHTGIMDRSPHQYDDLGEAEVLLEGSLYEMAMLERAREFEQIVEEVEDFLVQMDLQEEVELGLDERGIVMELPETIFFARGQADLRPEAREVLDKFSELFMRLERMIIVEGHTCDLPINVPRFPSNWELSVIRAVTVTRYLVEERGMDPRLLTATGYGEFHPLEPNVSEEARARNRRVTIVITVQSPEERLELSSLERS